VSDLRFAGDEAWRTFLAVDILQCIAASLCAVQLLVALAGTPTRFGFAAAIACAAVVVATPAVWRHEALERFPLAVSAYLSGSGHTSSLFPFFPWASYALLGAALGARYQHAAQTPRLFASRVLLPIGLLMTATSLVCRHLPFEPFGTTDFWSTSPNQFLLRAGLVLVLVGSMARVSHLCVRGGALLQALAQESLLVYVLHVCVVYGSRWNPGLRHIRGNSMHLLPALAYVMGLWIAMALVAWSWHHVRRDSPRAARGFRLGVATASAISVF
jgi:uncharacterized membrane protein